MAATDMDLDARSSSARTMEIILIPASYVGFLTDMATAPPASSWLRGRTEPVTGHARAVRQMTIPILNRPRDSGCPSTVAWWSVSVATEEVRAR
jgi:hypothetical protein